MSLDHQYIVHFQDNNLHIFCDIKHCKMYSFSGHSSRIDNKLTRSTEPVGDLRLTDGAFLMESNDERRRLINQVCIVSTRHQISEETLQKLYIPGRLVLLLDIPDNIFLTFPPHPNCFHCFSCCTIL